MGTCITRDILIDIGWKRLYVVWLTVRPCADSHSVQQGQYLFQCIIAETDVSLDINGRGLVL